MNVKLNEEHAESPEILAEAITKVADGFNSLIRSGINRDAIVTLIQADTKVNKKTINLILNSLGGLKKKYCR